MACTGVHTALSWSTSVRKARAWWPCRPSTRAANIRGCEYWRAARRSKLRWLRGPSSEVQPGEKYLEISDRTWLQSPEPKPARGQGPRQHRPQVEKALARALRSRWFQAKAKELLKALGKVRCLRFLSERARARAPRRRLSPRLQQNRCPSEND